MIVLVEGWIIQRLAPAAWLSSVSTLCGLRLKFHPLERGLGSGAFPARESFSLSPLWLFCQGVAGGRGRAILHQICSKASKVLRDGCPRGQTRTAIGHPFPFPADCYTHSRHSGAATGQRGDCYVHQLGQRRMLIRPLFA